METVRYLYDGSVSVAKSTFEYGEFINKFVIDKRDAIENSKYPLVSPIKSDKFTANECKAACTLAIGVLSRNIGDVKVLIRSKPNRCVFTMTKFAAGKLVLVPMSMGVRMDSEADSTGIACGGDAPEGCTLCVQSVAGFDVPFWSLTHTDEAKNVNMEIRYKSVTVSTRFGAAHQDWTFDIPVYVNRAPVLGHVELKYYKEAKPKTGKRTFAVLAPRVEAASSKAARPT